MPQENGTSEPLLAHVPTAELRRLLTEKFARDAADAAWKRLLRPITYFGLPGLVLGGTLIWQLLDAAVANKIAGTRTEIQTAVSNAANQNMQARFESLRPQIVLETRDGVRTAFAGEQGSSLRDALKRETDRTEFQQVMRDIVQLEMQAAWQRSGEELRASFLSQVVDREDFRNRFASDVERALNETGSIPRIIAGALNETVRRKSEGGSAGALSLLAAMNPAMANEAVSSLLVEGRRTGELNLPLQALASVSFSAPTGALGEPTTLLATALIAWSAYCTSSRCGADDAATRAMGAFLARARALPERERDAWVLALRLWHEELVADRDRPSREASLALVPNALGAIASKEAIHVLTTWFSSSDTELALSASIAVNSLSSESFSDVQRTTLFRSLWPRVVSREAVRGNLDDATWMALGAVSRGQATSNTFRAEAGLMRQSAEASDMRGSLSDWLQTSDTGSIGFGSSVGSFRPPATPCALTASVNIWAGAEERPSQARANLCALAALIRPSRGADEWHALRPALVQREQIALLAMLWTVAADATTNLGEEAVRARFAPLIDLLMSQASVPPEWQLASMLMLRSVPDRAAWTSLEQLGPDLRAHTVYAAATRWIYRPGLEDKVWFADRLLALPADVRTEVLGALFTQIIPRIREGAASADDLRSLIRAITPIRTITAFNSLYVASIVDLTATSAAVESASALEGIMDIATGRRRVAGVQALDAERLRVSLMDYGGWTPALAALASSGASGEGELVPTHGVRFGKTTLRAGAIHKLQTEDGGQPVSVTFLNPATMRIASIRPGGMFRVPSTGRNRARREGLDDWLFRINGEVRPIHLEPVELRSALAARSRESAHEATLPVGLPFEFSELPSSERIGFSGWVRIEGVQVGMRIRVTTFDLAPRVDTVVSAFLSDGTRLGRNDDGGDGNESLLDVSIPNSGMLLIQLENIGVRGNFAFATEILN